MTTMVLMPIVILGTLATIAGLFFARKERAARLKDDATRAGSTSRGDSKHAARA